MLLLLLACAHPPAMDPVRGLAPLAAEPGVPARPAWAHYVLGGADVVGRGVVDVEVEDGRIVGVGDVDDSLPRVGLSGRWLAPAFIDSHVHLAYLPEAADLAAGGIAGAVDLAAPMEFLDALPTLPRTISSGPMITAVGGYPTRSWGRDGYGIECEDAAAAAAAVTEVADAGARVVKLPIGGTPVLTAEALAAAVAAAHDRGLPVATHALGDADAWLAADLGVDVLAHTPLEALSDDTVASWAGGGVVTTLAAFGAGTVAVDNLSRLRAAGAVILYGTDFGNSRHPGIDPSEIAAMQAAGMDGAAILEAGTRAPAEWWGFEELGEISPGKAADVLVLDADPRLDPTTLGRPVAVYLDGEPA